MPEKKYNLDVMCHELDKRYGGPPALAVRSEFTGCMVKREAVLNCKDKGKWCDNKGVKLVQLRSQTAGVHGTNLYEGEILPMCAECRKANNGGFKMFRSTPVNRKN